MTRHARWAAVLMLLACSTPLPAQSVRRVINAAGIAAAGWHRLGDIVGALPPGATASVDGFNYLLTGSRVGFRDAGGGDWPWMVRVDGQSVPVALRGLWILDLLPVTIPQLDSVVVTSGPGVVDGQAVAHGVIDLYTRRAPRGVSFNADYQHGDESGDPGPYRYTARATPNVEKLGPFASGAAAYATNRISIDVAARYSSLNITDERIVSRFPTTFGQLQSDVNASGGSGIATISALGGEHFVIAGRGRFTGLMQLPEQSPVAGRVVASQIGASGTLVARGIRARYAANGTMMDLSPLGTASPALGASRTIGDAFVEAGRAATRIRFGAGINLDETTDTWSHLWRATAREWVTYGGPSFVTLGAEQAAGGLRFSAVVRREMTLGDSGRVAVTLNSLHWWHDADFARVESSGKSSRLGAERTALDARVEITSPRLLGFRPTWYARGYRFVDGGRYVPGSAFGDETIADNPVSGIAAGMDAGASPAAGTQVWLRGEISRLLGDDTCCVAHVPSRFIRGQASTPSGFIEASGSTTTPGQFVIALSARYSPGTTWGTFHLPSGWAPGVPATQRLDLSVNKWLWHERIRAQLVMRNLLNVAERTHPLGAQWNFRTHLAVTIVLP